ncbi:MAG: potassium channel family protein [Alphaproteobacteria bacterium]|nr:potassium channel family protein [Alphaproteobacteria bacterium]
MSVLAEWLRNHRFSLLNVALVLLILMTPMVAAARIRDDTLTFFFALVILFAVNAASDRRSHLIIAAALAVPALALRAMSDVADVVAIEIAGSAFIICLLFFTVGVVLARIVRVKESNFDVINGAAAIYLMLSITWSVSFEMIELLAPGSFTNLSDDPAAAGAQFLYYSLTTLTTLGYGDIAPINPVARIWATMEAVTGVLYIAVLVARLVSLYRA